MASNKIVRFGPIALTNVVANLLNPPALSGGTGLAGTNAATYLILKHLRIVNTTNGLQGASLWMGKAGASVAGTEFAFRAANVAPNGAIEWFGMARMDVADYLTGNASAAGLTISGEAEIGVA